MRLERKALIVSVLALAMLGLAVVPGLAAPEKQFTISAQTSVMPGDNVNLTVTVRNTTPNGNSNISSVILNSVGPAGWTINSLVGPGSGSTPDADTIRINGFSPIKPAKSLQFTLNVDVPNMGCNGGQITWTAEAYTGNSFGGDAFNFKPLHSQANLTTTIGSTCSSIGVTKYEDPNFNGEADAGEDTLSGWEFQLKDGSGNAVGSPELTDTNGSILYIVQPGNYSVCETDDRANPDAEGYGTTIQAWVNTAPGGNRCAPVTVSSGETEQLDFLNALGTLDCTGANSEDTETGGGTTVKLNRGPNADGSVCILVPYQLTADEDIVTFIKDLSTQPKATFKLVITWGVPALDYPTFGVTTFDLDGNFATAGDAFTPDNCVVVGGVAKAPVNPNGAGDFWPAAGTVKPWCHAGTVVEPDGDGYQVTETFLGGGDPSIVRNR